jgi:hypothetical protein
MIWRWIRRGNGRKRVKLEEGRPLGTTSGHITERTDRDIREVDST